MSLKLNTKYLEGFVSEHEYEGMAAQVTAAHNTLVNRNGLGNDFLGWVTLPEDYDKEEFARIKAAAARIKESAMFSSLSVSADLILVQELQSNCSSHHSTTILRRILLTSILSETISARLTSTRCFQFARAEISA